MRTIEIDFDVHQAIELERQSFEDTPNAALRRLLKLRPVEKAPAAEKATTAAPPTSEGRAWAGKGVILPHGTELRMDYNGRVHSGRIEDAEWVVEGHKFGSPSAAAGGVAVTKAGKKTSLDGWIYWQVKRPGDTRWSPLANLKS
jgi:hypothetical protein